MELRRYVAILNRRKWVILITTLVTLAVVSVGTFLMKPAYSAETVLRVVPAYGRTPTSMDLTYVERLMQTYLELLTSRPYMQEVIRRLGLELSPADLAERIKVQSLAGTELLKISVEDANADRAAAIANTLTAVLTELEAQNVRIAVIEGATTPRLPSKPSAARNTGLGLLVGLAGGIALALVFENLDSSVHSAGDVESATGAALLGQLPRFRALEDERPSLVTSQEHHASQTLQAFRVLAINTQAAADASKAKSLMVTSADPHAGASTVTANLAVSMAQAGRNVILIDGNMRSPWVHKTFGLSTELGLKQVLHNPDQLNAALQQTSVPGLRALVGGIDAAGPEQLFRSSDIAVIQKRLADQSAMVVWDAPSALSADALVLASEVNGVLLVATTDQTTGEDLRLALRQLGQVSATVLGIVLTQTHGYQR